MEPTRRGSNGKVDTGGGDAQAWGVPTTARYLQVGQGSPEQRSIQASRAARKRWRRRGWNQSKRLRQIMEAGAKAYTELVHELAHSPSPRTPNAARYARRLLGAFSNLYLFQGGDLPVEAQRLLALTVDELRRQDDEQTSEEKTVT